MSGDDKRAATALSDALRAALLRPIFMDRMWQITGRHRRRAGARGRHYG